MPDGGIIDYGDIAMAGTLAWANTRVCFSPRHVVVGDQVVTLGSKEWRLLEALVVADGGYLSLDDAANAVYLSEKRPAAASGLLMLLRMLKLKLPDLSPQHVAGRGFLLLPPSEGDVLRVRSPGGVLELNIRTRTLTVDGQPRELGQSHYMALEVLLRAMGYRVPTKELLEELPGRQGLPLSRAAITQLMHQLRLRIAPFSVVSARKQGPEDPGGYCLASCTGEVPLSVVFPQTCPPSRRRLAC